MVCLLGLGSCKGLKPTRQRIRCEQSSWEDGLKLANKLQESLDGKAG